MRRPALPSDPALRRWALVGLAAFVVLTVLGLAMTRGLRGLPALPDPDSVPFVPGLQVVYGASLVSGVWLAWLRPRNPIGWLLMLSGLLGGLCNAGQVYGARALVMPDSHLPLGSLVLSWSAPLWIPALLIPPTLLVLRYPTRRLSSRFDGWLNRLAIVGFVLVWVGYAGSPNSVTDEVLGASPPVRLPALLGGVLGVPGVLLLLGCLVGTFVSAVRRMLRSGFPERPQLAWLLTTAFAACVLVLGPFQAAGAVVLALVPVAVVVGVLRYRLLGIEIVVRRTLLYGIMTGVVLLVFVAATAGLALVLPRGPAPLVVAASVVAVGLSPLRERVQRLVDHLVYGERNDPWSALQRLASPVDANDQVPELPALVDAVTNALRGQGAALVDVDGEPAASSGTLTTAALRLPVAYREEPLGTLIVEPRRGQSSLAPADLRLLEALLPLIAAVWHGSRLTEDLREARARLVEATEAERDRLRRELHDGLGPSLTGIGLGLEALDDATPDRRAEIVSRLRLETAHSLDEVRRIIDDLLPGALTDHDLVEALRDRAAQISASSDLEIELDAPARLLLPATVEAATYRIADEALTNVLKHSGAGTCWISVALDGDLELRVRDDGCGANGSAVGGVGLMSMRERARRLGGTLVTMDSEPGFEVRLRLPVVGP